MATFAFPTDTCDTALVDLIYSDTEASEISPYTDIARDFRSVVRSSAEGSNFLNVQLQLQQALSEVRALHTVADDWDSYGTPAPTYSAMASATSVINLLKSVLVIPARILPSSEGGVAISFSGPEGRRALIETLNDGDKYIVLFDTHSYCRTIMLSDDNEESTNTLVVMSHYLRHGNP